MKQLIDTITVRIGSGGRITYEEALQLIHLEDAESLQLLYKRADEIRENTLGKQVDLCTIMNAKSGACSEDCKFCAQSVHYQTDIKTYDLLDDDQVLEYAGEMEAAGAHRFSLVTSGKGVSDRELDQLVNLYEKLRQAVNLQLCASHGIASYEQLMRLKDAGITRYHHNVETSRDYFDSICTSHSYEERLETIENVRKAGLELCCGGIIGLGESREDRVKMAFEIRDLGSKSIPVNVLNPIKGTPLEDEEILSPTEILKTMAVYRFIIPDAYIRYAGGRMALKELQYEGFRSGVNAAIVGNCLTTVGSDIATDTQMILNQGLKI